MSLADLAGNLGGVESLIAFAGLVVMIYLVDRFFLSKALEDA